MEARYKILYVFLAYNDNQLLNVQIHQDDIKSYWNISNDDILKYLNLNIADGLLTREVFVEMIDGNKDGFYYRLTTKGVEKLKEIYSLDLEEKYPELDDIQSLHYNLMTKINENYYYSIYERTLDEIIKCYKNRCYNASISMSGNLIEIYLTELLELNKIEILWFQKRPKDTECFYTNDLTLGQLFILATTKLPNDNRLSFIEEKQIELLKAYRNKSAHYNHKQENPSKEIASGVILFVSHFLKKRIEW